MEFMCSVRLNVPSIIVLSFCCSCLHCTEYLCLRNPGCMSHCSSVDTTLSASGNSTRWKRCTPMRFSVGSAIILWEESRKGNCHEDIVMGG